MVVEDVARAGTEPCTCRDRTASVCPASRSACVSPMHTMATSPARQAASALAITTASVSPWSVRRSEWPTMTCVAPASLSISAAMSPVCAPFWAAWQSCPPTLSGVLPRPTASAARVSSVAGTQIRPSVSASSPPMKPRPMVSSSARLSPVPFIFQLPATSGRIPGVMRLLHGGGRAASPHLLHRLPIKNRRQSNRHPLPRTLLPCRRKGR